MSKAGYSFLQVMMQKELLPWFVALPLCFVLVVGIACMLHYVVERPTIRLIRRLG